MLHVDFEAGNVDPSSLLTAVAKGMNLAAENVASKAMPLTPQDEGDLRRSQQVYEATAADPAAVVAYGGDKVDAYAVRQHEELGYKHTEPGTQAKYLEAPFNESRDENLELIAQSVRDVLS